MRKVFSSMLIFVLSAIGVNGQSLSNEFINKPDSCLTNGLSYILAAWDPTGYLSSEEMSNRLLSSLATLTTASVGSVTSTTAISGGNITSNGGAAVTARGVVWSTFANPAVYLSTKTINGSGDGSFTSNIPSLSPNTAYHVRAYATNSVGTSYGQDLTFTTLGPPTVTTTTPGSITATSASGGGNVTATGGYSVTARGVCWSTTANPTTSNSKTTNGSGTGTFSSTISPLTPGTTYHVRAYATNSAGTGYGSDLTFTTSGLPSVTTTTVNTLSDTSASCVGNVGLDGGYTVADRGTCWATSANPTTSNTVIHSGTGTGTFSTTNTSLLPGTQYHVRAFATNSAGTSYGSDLVVTTFTVPPKLTTVNVTSITNTTATSGGNITSSGGATVTTRGICWSTNANPDTSVTTKTTNGTGTGAYSCSMTNLLPNTFYHVRAFAINSAGIRYGNDIQFKTFGPPTVTTTSANPVYFTNAISGGSVVTDNGGTVTTRGVCWSTTSNPTISGAHSTNGGGTGSFTSDITPLVANTTYYYRAYATNSFGTGYGIVNSLTTLDYTIPILTTANPSSGSVTQTSATLGGNISGDGGAAVTDRGICVGTYLNPAISAPIVIHSGSGTGSYSIPVSNLTTNTTYHVRAFAINSKGIAYGNDVEFTTQGIPMVSTLDAVNVTRNSATCGGVNDYNGGTSLSAFGICWGLNANPTLESHSETVHTSGSGSFDDLLETLVSSTTYHYRAYATNSIGTGYGIEKTFTTSAPVAPLLIQGSISNITSTGAAYSGEITDNGGANITNFGVCWSVNSNPTVYLPTKTTQTGGIGPFSSTLVNLTPNTTYYVRAYATNSAGTSYGDNISFTTPGKPLITTGTVSTITQTSASVAGQVTSEGSSTVTERGICWSISANPTIADSHLSNGSGLGSFSVGLSELSPFTLYHVRAYAINSYGTCYGDDIPFTTLAAVPQVTTSTAQASSQTGASFAGMVTSDGGATVTTRGACWNTTGNPTLSNNFIACGSGRGSFGCGITGLTANTTYYIRVYATNSVGTVYGNILSFTTPQNPVTPTVTTTDTVSVAQIQATVGGNVVNDGGASVYDRGICWSTTANPTLSNTRTHSGAGTGGFFSTLSGLTPSTTYHYRAFALNSAGTSYGSDKSFSTKSISKPTLTTTSATALSGTGVTLGGDITSAGGTTVIERGVCYGTGLNPTISNNKTVVTGTNTPYSVVISQLLPGTTYHFRAFATNSAGTGYGNDLYFTTIGLPAVTTLAIDGVGVSFASVGGSVNSDGGDPVLSRGLCWSTSNSNLSVNLTTKTVSGIGIGTFSETISGLDPGTTYYVCAYATNSIGTVYGEIKQFSTSLPQSFLWLYNNGNLSFINGNVGIGTNVIKERLMVNGKVLTTYMELVSQIEADYVFEPDYALMPLTEFEKYIKENRHLPGIPSAEHFRVNGQNLGRMDNLLLEKIEELTLYIIRQNKELIEIQKEIDALRERIIIQ